MTDLYYNPDHITNGDGTLGTPWNAGASIVLASGDNLFIMRGTTSNTVRQDINAKNNIKVEAYASDVTGLDDETLPKPILTGYQISTATGDWTEPDGIGEAGLWEMSVSNYTCILGYATLGDRDTPSWPPKSNYYGVSAQAASGYASLDVDSEWDLNSALTVAIYTDDAVNPVTKYGDVYFSSIDAIPFTGRNSSVTPDNIVIKNIHFMHCFSGLYVRNLSLISSPSSGGVIQNCIFEHCFEAIYVQSAQVTSPISDWDISYNNFYENAGGTCTKYDLNSGRGFDIHHNNCYNSSRCVGIGALYGRIDASIDNPTLIHDNYIDTVFYAPKIWPGECFGIYVESQSTNVHVYRNTIKNVEDKSGLMSNTGATNSNIHFYSNIVTDCPNGFISNDSDGDNDGDIHIYNNVFYNVVEGIQIFGTAGTARRAYINNNISYGDNSASSVGLFETSLEDIIIESNNVFFNFNTDSTNITLDTTDITTDPLLDADNYPHLTSPAIGAGVWTGSIKLDKGSRPFKRSKPTIGAWEIANRDPTNRNPRE